MYIDHYQLYLYVDHRYQLLEDFNNEKKNIDILNLFIYLNQVIDILYKYLLDEVDNKDCNYSNLDFQWQLLVNNIDHYNNQ